LVGITGCSGYLNQITPEAAHDNFLRNLHSYVGESVDLNRGWLRRELLVSEERLPSGQLRFRFGVRGGRIKVFDVDAATRKITAASFEGTKSECSIPL
jgi:hypothetical protein